LVNIFSKPLLILGVTLLNGLVCGRALGADTRVQTASTISNTEQPIPQNCYDQARFLEDNLPLHPRPGDWTYIIVCDDATWKTVVAHLPINNRDAAVNSGAAINKRLHVSYFHASRYLEPASLLRLVSMSLINDDRDHKTNPAASGN
jgi:hypothetical protein